MLWAAQLSIWSCQVYQRLERLTGLACSPQQFTGDTWGVSSPTFPTGWRDYDQISRLCSLRTQGWGTEVRFHSLAAVRHSRRKEQCQPQLRTQRQQFSWAVNFGSARTSSQVLLVPLRGILLHLEVVDQFSLPPQFTLSLVLVMGLHTARPHAVREPMVRPR